MGKLHHKILLFKLVGFQCISGFERLHGVQANRREVFPNVDAALLIAELIHQQQNGFVPSECRFAVRVNIIFHSRLRQTRQEGGLPQRKVSGGGVEVNIRSGFDAVGKVAVKNLVEIQLEHLLLGITARDFCREDDFARFPFIRLHKAFVRQQQHARQLLGDCGCP